MKVLVTGGAGFIGSHIVDDLIEQGYQVVVVDNLATGSRENVNPKATFYRVNIGDSELAAIFEKEKPDLVNHHAAQTVVTKSVSEPVADARENILGSLNVIINCVRFGVRKIVYASSGGAVYGNPQYLPADEQHPVNPISQYGVSKHTVEHYLQVYSGQGLSYTILRYANVYGPRQITNGEAGVVAIFAGQMLRRETATIFGDGSKTRDYIHVSDVVAANRLALETGQNSIYNIGTGMETTDRQMFDTLAEVMEYKGKPRYAPVRPGEIYRTCLACAKARDELGWAARVSLREGLARTADYYRARYSHKWVTIPIEPAGKTDYNMSTGEKKR